MEKLHNENVDMLFKAILTLESVDECYKFFEDACTIKEILEISQRFQVAKLLDDGGKSYSKICEETGASTATITRINKSLNYGNDGYRLVIDRLKEQTND